MKKQILKFLANDKIKNFLAQFLRGLVVGFVLGLILATIRARLLPTKILRHAEKIASLNQYEVYKDDVSGEVPSEEKISDIIYEVINRYVPYKISKAFLKDDIKIVFADGEVCNKYYKLGNFEFGCLIPGTITQKPEILLIKVEDWYCLLYNEELLVEKEKQVMVHEIGHYLDFKMKFPSKKNEWKKIRDEEYYNSPIYKNLETKNEKEYYFNEQEYFAEVFRVMTYNKFCEEEKDIYEQFKNDCPKSFEYMQNIIYNF